MLGDRPSTVLTADDGARLVDELNGVFGANGPNGPNAGSRAVHAPGVMLRGTFVPEPGMERYTQAAVFTGGAVPAAVRFSNGDGRRERNDRRRDTRGIAVRFLPQGAQALDLVAMSEARFYVNHPDAYRRLTKNLERVMSGNPFRFGYAVASMNFMAFRRETTWWMLVRLATSFPPPSYLRLPYHTIHSFRWVNDLGVAHWVRFRWKPPRRSWIRNPFRALARNPFRGHLLKPRDFLAQRLIEEVAKQPKLTLEVQLWPVDDAQSKRGIARVNNPRKKWGRRWQPAGELTLTRVMESGEARKYERGAFNPLNLPPGIYPSDDPILAQRRAAYPESHSRRNQALREQSPREASQSAQDCRSPAC